MRGAQVTTERMCTLGPSRSGSYSCATSASRLSWQSGEYWPEPYYSTGKLPVSSYLFTNDDSSCVPAAVVSCGKITPLSLETSDI